MQKKSLFDQAQAASFGTASLPKDPRFRVQKPVYRSVAELMLAINNHPELVRPATALEDDPNFLTEEERLYLDKMEMYDRLKYHEDFPSVNNSDPQEEQRIPVDLKEIPSGEELKIPENQ